MIITINEVHLAWVFFFVDHSGRRVSQEVGRRYILVCCSVDFLEDIGQQLLHCRVRRIYDIRGKADGTPLNEWITFGPREVGTLITYRRHEAWRGVWGGQGGGYGGILMAGPLLLALWLHQCALAYERFSNHGVAIPLKH